MQHGDFAGVINSTHQLTLGLWWGHLHTEPLQAEIRSTGKR